ncbi:MAG TPA: monovalent cation/H+ antiporter subunit D family protein, partial [Thermoplasmata archaeon]
MSLDFALLLTVFVPFLAAPGILALRRRPNPREALSVVTAIVTFVFSASLLPSVFTGSSPEVVVFRVAPGLA